MTETLFPIVPFCLSRGVEDRTSFAPIGRFFADPAIRATGCVAVARRFTTTSPELRDHGPNGAPVFLRRLPEGRLATEDTAPVPDTGCEADRAAAARATLQAAHTWLRLDMHYVGRTLWMVCFPRLVLLQAEEISATIEEARRIVGTQALSKATTVRCACATIRLPPPTSAHAQITLHRDVADALALLREFRPEAIAQMRAAGFRPGALPVSDAEAELSRC